MTIACAVGKKRKVKPYKALTATERAKISKALGPMVKPADFKGVDRLELIKQRHKLQKD